MLAVWFEDMDVRGFLSGRIAKELARGWSCERFWFKGKKAYRGVCLGGKRKMRHLRE